jgi:hypothetical protein
VPKYYIMLVDLATNRMEVPVKALLNPYNQQPAYCAGMPQFFGGTDQNDQPPVVVMGHEITEESRRTLELTSAFPQDFLSEGNMFYYYAGRDRWAPTGVAWGPARSQAEAEMDRIVAVDLTQFNNAMNDAQIITVLLNQTGSTAAPLGGQADFNASATRTAFTILIRAYLAGQLH